MLRRRFRFFWALSAGSLGCLLVAGWIGSNYAGSFFLDQAAQRADSALRLTVAGLDGALGRYRPLPELLADTQIVRSFLTSPPSADLADHVNRELKKIKQVTRASNVYLIGPDGTTIAADNFDSKTSFVGKNFSYRPYFKVAMTGKPSRYFALGTTSLKRGYYFAAPVRNRQTILGVVAVKMDVDEIEAAWAGLEHEIIVVDPNGIIFMSGRSQWRLASIEPLSAETLERISSTRQYPRASLSDLPLKFDAKTDGDHQLATLEEKGDTLRYLVKSATMRKAGWTVHVLSNTAQATAQTFTSVAAGILTMLTALLSIAFFVQRRQRLLERLVSEQQAKDELEVRVSERTADLNQANVKLVEEIGERKSAELELRKTQNDLIQAGKLAALGQMSAALSHEFNQPLSAAKSYADNAAAYIDRGRNTEARENIIQISALVDRMAAIGKHLRNFARKPNEKLSAVPLAAVINDAVEILSGRIRAQLAQITVSVQDKPLFALGGRNRLQQVLVNLLGNALDAIETGPNKQIKVSAKATGPNRVQIKVKDYGTGIDEVAIMKIFDPFFTTKGVGKGLGLGLSISYNIIKDFGGMLSARNHCEGGAEFLIELDRAKQTD